MNPIFRAIAAAAVVMSLTLVACAAGAARTRGRRTRCDRPRRRRRPSSRATRRRCRSSPRPPRPGRSRRTRASSMPMPTSSSVRCRLRSCSSATRNRKGPGGACVGTLDALLGREPKSAEALALQSSCYGYLAGLGGMGAIRNGSRSGKAVEAAVALEAGNPRVILADGFGVYHRPKFVGGDKAKGCARFREAASRLRHDTRPAGSRRGQFRQPRRRRRLGSARGALLGGSLCGRRRQRRRRAAGLRACGGAGARLPCGQTAARALRRVAIRAAGRGWPQSGHVDAARLRADVTGRHRSLTLSLRR